MFYHGPHISIWLHMGEISTVERGRDGRDVEGAKGWGVLLVWRTTLMSKPRFRFLNNEKVI